MVLMSLLSCGFSASGGLVDSGGDDPTPADDSASPGDTGDTGEQLDPLDRDDDGDAFPVTVTLANIPANATYKLTVNRLSTDGSEELGLVDEDFGSGTVSLVLEDSSGPDDGGVYEVVVGAIANADCGSAYLMTVAGE